MVDDKNKKPNKPNDKMTPEEKLFKVIATGGRDYHFDDPSQSQSSSDEGDQDPFGKIEHAVAQVGKFFSEIFKTRKIPQAPLPDLFKSHGATQTLSEVFQIKNVNRGLISLVTLLAVFFIFDFLFGRQGKGPSALEPTEASIAGMKQEIATALPAVPELSHYLNPAKTRDPFSLPKPKAEGAPTISEGSSEVQPPPVNYKLVGISWDDREYVAMIEYEGEKAARFVRKGDSLQNGVKVKKVTETSVSLALGDREWDLT